jgi:hypothetical protein
MGLRHFGFVSGAVVVMLLLFYEARTVTSSSNINHIRDEVVAAGNQPNRVRFLVTVNDTWDPE